MHENHITAILNDAAFLERFWSKINRSDGCWEWTASRDILGYGRVRFRFDTGIRVTILAHRLAWMIANGPIPDGLCVCHSCDNPPCCNPRDLFLGTNADNNRDMVTKGRCRGAVGTANSHCAISEAVVREIRRMGTGRRYGDARRISAALGVPYNTVTDILLGRTWRHLA